MLTTAIPRDIMPRSKQARLDKDIYTFSARLPASLGEWLKEYARQRDISLNVALIEAVELLQKHEQQQE